MSLVVGVASCCCCLLPLVLFVGMCGCSLFVVVVVFLLHGRVCLLLCVVWCCLFIDVGLLFVVSVVCGCLLLWCMLRSLLMSARCYCLRFVLLFV